MLWGCVPKYFRIRWEAWKFFEYLLRTRGTWASGAPIIYDELVDMLERGGVMGTWHPGRVPTLEIFLAMELKNEKKRKEAKDNPARDAFTETFL